jgi:hypothetical protein
VLCIPVMSAVKSGKVAAPESGKSRQVAMGNSLVTLSLSNDCLSLCASILL